MKKILLLVDAHAIIHRAFHALPNTLVTKEGVVTNAIYGFFLMIQKVITDFQPTHIAICFDTPKPTFRKELYKDYQAKRPPMDASLKLQIPIIKQLIDSSGLVRIEKEGYEADDVIGTVAEKLKDSFDLIYILTGDRDLLQLSNEKTSVIAPKKGVSDFYLFTPKNVYEKYGVSPSLIPDFKALAGDSSDNYNTAKGIGPKTASKLLSQFGSVSQLLNNTNNISNEKHKTILNEHKDQILLFKKIATIVKDVEIEAPLSKISFSGYKEELKSELSKLELYSLISKLFSAVKKQEVDKKNLKKDKLDDQIEMF